MTTIRRGRVGDLAALSVLERAFPGDRLSPRSFRRHLSSPRSWLLVAERNGGLDGYVLLLARADSPWWRLYSLIRAEKAPPGTGRRLLEAGIDAARAAGARGVRLEVREDNTAAQRLYQALGFTLFSTRDGYYEDRARALRMALDLDGPNPATAGPSSG